MLTSVWAWGAKADLEVPMEVLSPRNSAVMSVPMALMMIRAPPGWRFAKVDTSRTAPSTITQQRPFKI